MEDYKQFLSRGSVFISDSENAEPVQILCDTGASQTLLLEGVLLLSNKTYQ